MNRIIVEFKPFIMNQMVYVYQNGELFFSKLGTITDIDKIVIDLSEKYSIYTVDLAGPKMFSKGIQKRIEKAELTKYHQNKIKINLI